MTTQSSPSAVHQSPEKTPFTVQPIGLDPESQAKRGWEARLNGEVITEPIESLELEHKGLGVIIKYGNMTDAEGNPTYDVPEKHEREGGGSVTTPYTFVEGKLYIGVVGQLRPLAGGIVLENPRGFLDAGETHLQGAQRETTEETGLDNLKGRIFQTGSEVNTNSAFENTSGEDEGTSYFGVEVYSEELTLMAEEDGSSYLAFTETIRAQAQGDKVAERILSSKFIPLDEARRSRDGFTINGVGFLLAHMVASDTLRFMGIQAPTPIAQQ